MIECEFKECLYSENLMNVLKKIKAKEILKLTYFHSGSGFLEIAVLLEDYRVISYNYEYEGSREDKWSKLEDCEIELIIENGMVIFPCVRDYLNFAVNQINDYYQDKIAKIKQKILHCFKEGNIHE